MVRDENLLVRYVPVMIIFCFAQRYRDADTPDLHFLIDKHPSHPGLHLAVGGSAHGFKMMPVVGKYVVDSLEGSLEDEARNKWRWRPGAKMQHANPHPGPLLELSEISGFKTPLAKL